MSDLTERDKSGLEQKLNTLNLQDTDKQILDLTKNKQKKNEKSNNHSKLYDTKEQGKFVELPGAEMGKVVVRFPPEASGFLHIGHAKAALLNEHYKLLFNGRFIMRFDDTNPAKEKDDFEKVILEDVEMLKIKPDIFTYTSDYFDKMLDMCKDMLLKGQAYVDDTDADRMRLEREKQIESVNRNNSIEKNLELWNEMVLGTEIGKKCCVRAKINMQSTNGCLRDPTIYRCKPEFHPRTGNKYKVYPTYDFACPIVDSLEGVTHCLRTTEYTDRDQQFYWFCDTLKLGSEFGTRPYVWSYSRLNMTNTVLSKRKLAWFVEQGIVDNWDDPRMPTVRGILRRGMHIDALKQFIISQGSSKSVTAMHWDKIWSINRTIIDGISPRHTAVMLANDNESHSPVEVIVQDIENPYKLDNIPKHPKNPTLGFKNCVWAAPKIIIDYSDAELLEVGRNTTFINWGNLLINRIERNNKNIIEKVYATTNLKDTDFKSTLKITWLPYTNYTESDQKSLPMLVPVVCVYFDNLISKPVLAKDEDFKQYLTENNRWELKMLGDSELQYIKKGNVVQLQRRGYFICDSEYIPYSVHTGKETPIILFNIPDGHTKTIPTVKIAKTNKIQNDASIIIEDLINKITEQGNKIRIMKSNKAPKGDITEAVNILLALKAEYKTKTGLDFKPGEISANNAQPNVNSSKLEKNNQETALITKINEQGNIVRSLKTAKSSKESIDEQVKILLALKNEYKNITGKDYQPNINKSSVTTDNSSTNIEDLINKITEQGNKIRVMKSNKAPKGDITEAVNILLALKAEYKTKTGLDFKPGEISANNAQPNDNSSKLEKNNQETALITKINEQGNIVRSLKTAKSSKESIDEQVKILLALKNEYKNITGKDYQPNNNRSSITKVKNTKDVKTTDRDSTSSNTKVNNSKDNKTTENNSKNTKKITKLGLDVRKVIENFGEWYSQVLTKGEMLEYYDISGCYIIRPWAYGIWEIIQQWFDSRIKNYPLNVSNCYFPIFVSKAVLEKEKNHIADFAPEVAWVTKSGDTDLMEHIAIRPTSETVMYPAFAKWIQSYRDLPLKLNQWNNVVRWEFKHPQPFLRTREFLWQEGHHAYASQKEAEQDILETLDYYEYIYKNMLAVPVIKGKKTEKEKFAGGVYTMTCEAYIPISGKAIQGATTHYLGTNFSRMFDVSYEHPETHEQFFVHQISYGITTRTIGVMVMVHGDDRGLIIPPRVATKQIVIVPCGVGVSTPSNIKQNLTQTCIRICNLLKGDNEVIDNDDYNIFQKHNSSKLIRADVDLRENYSPGWKFNHWELKGVPLRLELGPKDLDQNQIIAVRRDTGEKLILSIDPNESEKFVKSIVELLNKIQRDMLAKADKELKENIVISYNWLESINHLEKKRLLLIPFCGYPACEDNIKRDTASDDKTAEFGTSVMGAKSLCVPLEQPTGDDELKPNMKCIHPDCEHFAKSFTLFGRSY